MPHSIDPENVTRILLDPAIPYLDEIDDHGEWPLDKWRFDHPQRIDVPVADPFNDRNTIRLRVSPEGKPIPSQLIRRYVVAAGDEVLIPRCHRRHIRFTSCAHAACLQAPHACQKSEHAGFQQVVGGYSPGAHLCEEAAPPRVHPSIQDKPPAEAQPALLEAINPKPVKTPESAAIERARARRAAGGAR